MAHGASRDGVVTRATSSNDRALTLDDRRATATVRWRAMASWSLPALAVFMIVFGAGCADDISRITPRSTADATSSTGSGTPRGDLVLLHSIIETVVPAAGFEPVAIATETASESCAASSSEPDGGRRAAVTIVLAAADGGPDFEEAAAVFRRINDAEFDGEGTVEAGSPTSGGSVRLQARGFEVEITPSVGPAGLSLAAVGPCHR